MVRLEHYIPVGRARLRCGYTTGTCAAAAARAAAEALLTGLRPACVQVNTPEGIAVQTQPVEWSAGPGWVRCAVEKDGGDDPDVTSGIKIFAQVSRRPGERCAVDGGEGVGRVTLPGLDQPVGAAAINSVPRRMILQQLEQARQAAGETDGLRAVISVPSGEALAQKTFNPRLGIEGGISILGTSGIVRPMSEAALVDSIRLELDLLRAQGVRRLLAVPGNYGADYAKDHLGLRSRPAVWGNYLGESIDYAAGLGFESVLLVGHLGKLVKTAAGIFNTHSAVADGRREVLAAHTALAGGDRALVNGVYAAATTDGALAVLESAGLLKPVMASITRAVEEALSRRAGAGMEIQVVIFSHRFGLLGRTSGADDLLKRHQRDKNEATGGSGGL
ncbi:cobalamin biosynthesis protein CbiD [Pseudoflavonifractor sp. 524-17]|uniref:cobalt-precorrin-5B (C(1))-methyltransferase CbiD n=1 Tax=Pseudoflavonifractor sp. 524-17 TaxID=2304577 RepID=UPI001379E14A|nr:cobalt-precorrin-5B (C(1))-methyltransferase CbiD [Pseudoflavonifractor sp. 524-17]NCE63235.1 cobalamin biosynthesis protein CbiD [Pseudoflavonifractor sp. 524-17]